MYLQVFLRYRLHYTLYINVYILNTSIILHSCTCAHSEDIPVHKGLMSIDIPQTLARMDIPLTNNAANNACVHRSVMMIWVHDEQVSVFSSGEGKDREIDRERERRGREMEIEGFGRDRETEKEKEREERERLQSDPPVICCRKEGFTRSDFDVSNNISMTSVLLHTQLGVHFPELHSTICSTCSR